MKKLAFMCFVALGLLGLVGCGGGGGAPVLETDDTLSAEEEADLRRTLIGHTWVVEAVTPSPNMRNLEERTSRIQWEFKNDETVLMSMKIAKDVPFAGGTQKSGRFNWRLEGRELYFTGGDARKRFRVLSWSDERMMWLNYEEDDYFVLYPRE